MVRLVRRVARGVGQRTFRLVHRRIIPSDGVVKKVAGRWVVCVPDDAPSVASVKKKNLTLVTSALEDERIDYFLLRNISRNRFRVAVREDDRERVARALVDRYGLQPVYLRVGGPKVVVERGLLRDASKRRRSRRHHVWRIFRYFAAPGGTLVLGARHGCDVEFVSSTPDGIGLQSLNRVTSFVPASLAEPSIVHVGGEPYRSLRVFSEINHVEEIDFPIDIVYTWVDGNDAAWRAKKERAFAEVRPEELNVLAANPGRYHSRDELRYSLRSVAVFADFVRTVFLVTDDQVPEWLNTANPRIRVVHHGGIFGESGRLPTFNSHAIESRLHHIEGLAEHYLYMNDDVFFGRPIAPRLFFLSNGMARFFLSKVQIDLGDPTPEDAPVDSAAKNNRALIHEHFGKVVTQKFKHVPHPQIRSVMEEMERVFADDFKRVSSSQFRNPTDVSVASSLHHYYAYLMRRSVPGEIKYTYVNLSDPDLPEKLSDILKRRPFDTFCLNETDSEYEDQEMIERRMLAFLERYFPFKSEFER